MAFNFAAFLLKRGKAEISDLRLLCVGERQVAIVKFYGTRREKGNISVLSFALCLPCSTFYVTYPSDLFSCNASTRLLLYVFYPPVDITKIAPLMPFSIIHFQDRDGGRNLRAFIGLWWVYTQIRRAYIFRLLDLMPLCSFSHFFWLNVRSYVRILSIFFK